jgi:hypothetical protein
MSKAAVIALIVACARTTSTSPESIVVFDIERAEFEPGGGPGSTRAAIFGDPSRAGPYLHVIRVPPNMTSPPHEYSDARTYTVIAGTWYLGFGDHYDAAKLVALHAGSFYRLPARTAVFTTTKDDGAVIQIGGTGPSRHIER